ncbi:acyl-CoA N-acyltransferase [Gilbertella persicaria]|nr:acyl-CoA N-acyltransferase [Gilbertella persicaria]KAI8087658.1 acyl-CoA N-acyltransferase [Gilbertella persicaria]
MSDDKQPPTEKEIQDLAKKVDKLVSSKKVKQLMKNPSAAAAAGPSDPQQAEALKAQLRQMMESMALLERSGKIKTTGKKDLGSHQFWKTQPVPAYEEDIVESGPIEPDTPYDEIRKEPMSLPKEFEWCEIDMTDEKQVKELYDLLTFNYVEDDDAQFRFDYSAEFLKWALLPPNWKQSWLLGVRVASNKKLVAFISGVPVALRTYETIHHLTEINFLCVHKKLRSKRLAPVLIKEITRRSHLEGVFQAVYTGGVVLPKPVSTCRYYHRSLNPKKLVECNFSRVPPRSTLSRMIKNYKVPEKTSTPGLREMRKEDAPQVRELLNKYLARFDFAPVFETDADVEHWVLPHEKVVWSYVVEEDKKITDVFSFYSLPSSVIGNPKHSTLNAAYMFYYAVTVPDELDEQEKEKLIAKRLNQLIADALVLAKKADFDVVNTLDLMDNAKFVEEQKFGNGDGYLNYYMYNWRCPDVPKHKIGLVML